MITIAYTMSVIEDSDCGNRVRVLHETFVAFQQNNLKPLP